MTTVLVTGVGAIIGYGVLRSLRDDEKKLRLIGTDIYPDAVGQAWADHFVLAPLTSSGDYSHWLEETIVKHQVDLVIPGIEQDAHYFSDHRELFDRLAVKVVINNQKLVNLTRDKWLMHEELRRIGSNTRIPSCLEGSFDHLSRTLGLPFILKPRCSYASKGLVKINNQIDFDYFASKLGHDLMAQPVIGNDDEEFTVAVFGDGQGQVLAQITMQRRLAADGSTSKAWIRQDQSLNDTVSLLCAHFKPIGPTNLQFRRDKEHWKLLEINPRISSSTSIRTAFGYNEAAMCLDFYLANKTITQPKIKPGFSVRYIEDYIVYDRDNF
jgi:carbamoyl-phosphate synthase large subunit